MKKTAYLLALIIAASFISCKKDSNVPSSPTTTQATGNTSGDIYTIAGGGDTGLGDGGAAISAEIALPSGMAMDGSGNLYIVDAGSRIRKVNTDGVISTIAGNGIGGYKGDGGAATSAEIDEPTGVTVDNSGNIYIADYRNYRIRKINTSGVISTIAGNGTYGFSGDGGPATLAELYLPSGIAVDASGNIYIADAGNNRIRKVNSGGIISTVAGNGSGGYSGDGGPATSAELTSPSAIAVDHLGNVYIVDTYGNHIRVVNGGGIISTIAGNGKLGYSGDGGIADSAELSSPSGVAVDRLGNVYIADRGANRIRMINTSGIISTIAGSGTPPNNFGFSGDGGPATSAQLNEPWDVVVDASGNVYIADTYNQRIRKISK